MSVIVLSAGGTGGHLFPAEALSRELIKRGRSIIVMTDARFAHYATQFPGARIQTVPSSPFNAITAPFKIAAGIAVALARLMKLKPAAVIGFGGYPSVPVMLAATLLRLPTAIIEQNAVVGRANRLVMNRVKVVAAAFPIARFAPADVSKIVLTGNPLRPEVEALWGTPYNVIEAGGPLRLLVFGGSQGARALSEIVPAALTRLPHELKLRLSVVQQCRPEDIENVRTIYRNAEIRAHLDTFFPDLPKRMAETHLVIARAGAGTVGSSEIQVDRDHGRRRPSSRLDSRGACRGTEARHRPGTRPRIRGGGVQLLGLGRHRTGESAQQSLGGEPRTGHLQDAARKLPGVAGLLCAGCSHLLRAAAPLRPIRLAGSGPARRGQGGWNRVPSVSAPAARSPGPAGRHSWGAPNPRSAAAFRPCRRRG